MRKQSERGAALIAVLWLSAILVAIAFSVTTIVRGETERTATLSDGVRTYFLAAGAIERALAYIEWGPSHRYPDNTPRYYENGMGRLNFNFPSGAATVQIMPEAAKFDINNITPPELMKLLVFLGGEMVAAIGDEHPVEGSVAEKALRGRLADARIALADAGLDHQPRHVGRDDLGAPVTEALGEAAHGLRVGLIPSRSQPARVTLLIWNVGDSKVQVVGKAYVVLDGVECFTFSAEPVLPPGVLTPGYALRLT